jgi:hypothetical protein
MLKVSIGLDLGSHIVMWVRKPCKCCGGSWVIMDPIAKKSFLIASIVPARDGFTSGSADEIISYPGKRVFIHDECFCLGCSFVSVTARMSG